MSGLTFLAWWYGVGILSTMIWPAFHFREMTRENWKVLAMILPVMALLGPLGCAYFYIHPDV